MAAGSLRPTVKGVTAELALSRRVLDFRSGVSAALLPGYSMAGLATRADEAGNVVYAPHNLLPESENFGAAAWAKTAMTGSGNTLTETAVSSLHQAFGTISMTGDFIATFLVTKPTDRGVGLILEHGSGGFYVYWLVSGFTTILSYGTPSGSATLLEATAVSATTARLTIRVTGATTAFTKYTIRTFNAAGADTYLGDPAKAFTVLEDSVQVGAVRGAHLPTTTAASFNGPVTFDNGIKALRLEGPQTNLSPKTSDLSSVNAWSPPSGASVQVNVGVAPDGSSTADKLVEDTNNGIHYVRSVNYTIVAGSLNTFSYSVKAAGRSKVRVFLSNGASNSGVQADFTLSGLGARTIGANVGTGSNASATIVARANGWYDISITGQVDASSTTAGVFVYVVHDTLGAGYQGDGVSGLLFSSHQFEPGAVSTSRIINDTTAAVLRPGAQQIITGAEFNRLFPAARDRGQEFISNGDAGNGLSSWTTVTGTPSASGGVFTLSGDPYAAIAQPLPTLVVGKTYRVTLTLVSAPGQLWISHRNSNTPGQGGRTTSAFTSTLGTVTMLFVANAAGNNLELLCNGVAGVVVDNISVRELDTSVPSPQAFTLFITLADRPRPFEGSAVNLTFFAINNGGSYSAGPGLLIRSNGSFFQAGGNNSAATTGAVGVDGKNVAAITVDVANKRLSLSVNGSAPVVITNLDFTGVNSNRVQMRGIDSIGNQGAGTAYHQTLEILPLMSDAALQAECARRFALP